MEILLFTNIDGLPNRIEQFRDLSVLAPSKVEQAVRLLASERPPQILYLDDSRAIPAADMWRLIQTAQAAEARVLVNLFSTSQAMRGDVQNSGIPVMSSGDAEQVAAWVGEQLNQVARAGNGRLPVVAVGAAKGGIGKTFATGVLAEGLRRRGLNVLVLDGDISNPGLVPAFRVPSSAPSYLHLVQRGPSAWTPGGIQPFIYQPDHTQPTSTGWGRIDFLIGSHTVARAENDVRLPDWQGLYSGITQLDGYDLLLLDTPPDYLRRPYATHALMSGGFVILPSPPGARERMGVGHLLEHFREVAPDKLDRCALLFMQPERGAITQVKDVVAALAARYPQVRALGTLPRAPRLASLADEHDGYLSMLDLGANTPFAQSVHRIVDSLCVTVGVTPKLPMPRISMWAGLTGRMRGERVSVPAAHTSLGALAQSI